MVEKEKIKKSIYKKNLYLKYPHNNIGLDILLLNLHFLRYVVYGNRSTR